MISIESRISGARSAPSAPKAGDFDTLRAMPNGVGQPRSECARMRSAPSVLTAACQPFAVAMQPIGMPSR